MNATKAEFHPELIHHEAITRSLERLSTTL
jgi:hypothetical protein